MKITFWILGFALILNANTFGQTSKFVVKLDSVSQLILTKSQFNPKDHSIQYNTSGEYLISIDNKPFFGTDLEMPVSQLISAILTIGTTKYDLDIRGMFNPWNGEAFINQRAELKSSKGSAKVLRVVLSDGAGSYATEWTIAGNGPIRTILSDDEWITHENFEK